MCWNLLMNYADVDGNLDWRFIVVYVWDNVIMEPHIKLQTLDFINQKNISIIYKQKLITVYFNITTWNSKLSRYFKTFNILARLNRH
jgi:hypothetical protein